MARGTMLLTSTIEQLLPRPTFEDTDRAPCPLFFSTVYAVVKQTPVRVYHTTQSTCWEISVSAFSRNATTKCPVLALNQQPYDY